MFLLSSSYSPHFYCIHTFKRKFPTDTTSLTSSRNSLRTLSWATTEEALQDYDRRVCHADKKYAIYFQDSCAPKGFLLNQDVRKLLMKFQTNSNNLSLKFGPSNFSDWRSGSHMAGCSPLECDGICWCSLIFLSSQANFSPNHIVSWAWGAHLPLHHLCWARVHVGMVRALPEWQGTITAISPFHPSLQR